MKRLLLSILLSAAVAAAAGVDGRWTSEIAARAGKGGGKKGGAAKSAIITLNLKSAGDQLTGSVSGGGGKRAGAMEIQNGKIQGDSFTFTTVQKGKQGEVKWSWRGTVKGDEITGTRTREGGRRGQPFTAKKSS